MIGDIIFVATWFILLVFAIRLMSKAWGIVPPKDIDLRYNVEKRTVTKTIHPEMEDVEVGDELLVVKFDQPEREIDPRFRLDSPELHNLGDPLYKSMQDRIQTLREEEGTTDIEEDDDEEGGLVVRK